MRDDQVMSSSTPSIVIATTTWNSSDIIEQFLDHHLAGDVERVFVMDFGSYDDTLERLRPYCEAGTVVLSTLDSLEGKDSSNLLLNHIRSFVPVPQWCLFIDPDEFISAPAALSSAIARVPEDVVVLTVPRFNVTGVRPNGLETSLRPFVDLNLKIRQRSLRSGEERRALHLSPPWIFTEIPGKVAVRVNSAVSVGWGDHEASGGMGGALVGQELWHFPFRSWPKFEEKILLAKMDFSANPHLSSSFGWHWRRWITIHESGHLPAEYLQQYVDAADVDRLTREGILERIVYTPGAATPIDVAETSLRRA